MADMTYITEHARWLHQSLGLGGTPVIDLTGGEPSSKVSNSDPGASGLSGAESAYDAQSMPAARCLASAETVSGLQQPRMLSNMAHRLERPLSPLAEPFERATSPQAADLFLVDLCSESSMDHSEKFSAQQQLPLTQSPLVAPSNRGSDLPPETAEILQEVDYSPVSERSIPAASGQVSSAHNRFIVRDEQAPAEKQHNHERDVLVKYPLTAASGEGSSAALAVFLEPSRKVKPQDRVLARGLYPEKATDNGIHHAQRRKFTADPSRLLPGKEGKYFAVRHGRQPGIYYSPREAERQVSGFSDSVAKAFKKASDAEGFMNHRPQQCKYAPCGNVCRETAQPISPGSMEEEISKARACDCCNTAIAEEIVLCSDCFHHPTAWVDFVVNEQGLVAEQASVLCSVANGENVFFTGAAGTGKSKLIHAIKRYLGSLGASVAAVAPTGIASVNIQGRTLHSYAGWDPNIDRVTLHDLCQRASSKSVSKRFSSTDVLIIDEISMVDSNSLTRLSQIMQAVATRNRDGSRHMPCGGIQLVISGDFFQLPPVKPFEFCISCGQPTWMGPGGVRVCEEHGDFNVEDTYAFASPVWKAAQMRMVELKHIHRQADPVFVSILSSLRIGHGLTATAARTLQYHEVNIHRDDATKLVPSKAEARDINNYHIRQIPRRTREMTACDDFRWERSDHPDLGELSVRLGSESGPLRALAHERSMFDLDLKLSMLVVLIANVAPRQGLVNGSIGRIVDFVDMTDESMPRATGENQDNKDKKNNKDQKDKAQVLSGEHAAYQAAQVRQFRDRLPASSRKWPVVEFKDGVRQVIFAQCQVSERGRFPPYSLLSRTQIPLLPGYALTIHSSQGMTLDSVVVNLARCWEQGQAYVALSRARSLDGLIVDTLPSRTDVDPFVKKFMRETFG